MNRTYWKVVIKLIDGTTRTEYTQAGDSNEAQSDVRHAFAETHALDSIPALVSVTPAYPVL